MASRLSDVVRRASATMLIWVGSLALGLADVLYAGLVPVPRPVADDVALAFVAAASAVFAVAVAGAALRWHPRHRPAMPTPVSEDLISREAAWGIVQLEAWLARQDRSRDG